MILLKIFLFIIKNSELVINIKFKFHNTEFL